MNNLLKQIETNNGSHENNSAINWRDYDDSYPEFDLFGCMPVKTKQGVEELLKEYNLYKYRVLKKDYNKKEMEGKLEETRSKIAISNQKYIISLGKLYAKKWSDAEKEDLTQEANIALINAIDTYRRFREGSYSPFIDYLDLCARNQIHDAICDGRIINIPLKAEKELNKIKEENKKFYNSNKKQPTLTRLIKNANLTEKKIKKLLDVNKETIPINYVVINEADKNHNYSILNSTEDPLMVKKLLLEI